MSSSSSSAVRSASLTLVECIDHVKLLASQYPHIAAKGAEYFQDNIGWMPYRKQVVRAAFAELAQGKACQNTTPISVDRVMDSCIKFIVDHKAFSATPDVIQDMNGMWFRKSAIRDAIALQKHTVPDIAAKFVQGPKPIKLLSELVMYLQETLKSRGDMPTAVLTGNDLVDGVRIEVLENQVKTSSGAFVEPDSDDEDEAELRKLPRTCMLVVCPK